MATVQEHYDKHLGKFYSWMLGDKAAAVDGARTELRDAGISHVTNSVALDLGTGNGIYALAMADLGYSVLAIDSCASLLDELKADIGSRPIKPIHDDMLAFRRLCDGQIDVVVCMGDTLTHLESEKAIERLFADIKSALKPGGKFIATFRDYVTSPLQGTARFIPIRSDNDRILTCFLEYGEKTVTVHDILHERQGAQWKMTVSAYSKLRLDPKHVLSMLTKTGMTARPEKGPRGMIKLVGENRV